MQPWLPNNEIPKVHKRTKCSQTTASTENCKEPLKELLRRMLESNKKSTILQKSNTTTVRHRVEKHEERFSSTGLK